MLTIARCRGASRSVVGCRRRSRRSAQPPAAAAAERRRAPRSPAATAARRRASPFPTSSRCRSDAETVGHRARRSAQVLWDDLNFEREFALIPRDIYATIPPATSFADVPFDRWRELNADGVVVGTVQKIGDRRSASRCGCSTSDTRQSAFGKEYSGSAANPRLYAHTISDEIHQQQRALRGVARTKLTFDSDRDGERMTGTVESRGVKEIYIADYDGENQRRVTASRSLNITPLVARRAVDCLHVVPPRAAEHLHLEHLPGHARGADEGRRRELAAGVVARRHARRVHVDARRQLGDLRREPRRLERAAADEQPGDRHHADLVAVGHADRVHVRPDRHAADLRSSAPTASGRAAADVRVVRAIGRPGRRRRTTRSPTRRARARASTSRSSTWRRAQVRQLTFGEGTQREPGVRAQRPAHRVHVDAVGQDADLHDRARRQEPEADHADRQQLPAGLVQDRRWSSTIDDDCEAERCTMLCRRSSLCRRRSACVRQEDRRWPGRCPRRRPRRAPHDRAAARPPAPPRAGRPSRPRCRPSRSATTRSRRRRSTI